MAMATDHNLSDLRVLVLVDIMIVLDRNIMIMVNILELTQVKITIMESINFLLTLNIKVLSIIIIRVNIAQLLSPYYSNDGSSSQSSQPTRSNQHSYYYLYRNYIPGFYTYRENDDNGDFVPHRNSMWK